MKSPLNCAVIICSDRAASGERADQTTERLRNQLEVGGARCGEVRIVADERDQILRALRELSGSHDVVLTSGGTGIGPRDVTVDATLEVLDREIPGMGEAMRARSLQVTPMAMLSRATAGTLGSAVIVNLPGSPKGAVECLEVVMPALGHAVGVLRQQVSDCQESK